MSDKPCLNTDRELWRETRNDHSASVHVTEGGGIGINVGGHVFVRPVRVWHGLAAENERLLADYSRLLNTAKHGGSDACATCAAHVLVITKDLEPEIERLRAATWKYGKHLTACRMYRGAISENRCDCGWNDVREKLAGEAKHPSDPGAPDANERS